MNPSLSSRAALFLTGAMFLLPFLLSRHQLPIASFWNEWSAMILGLLALIALLGQSASAMNGLPRIIWLPLAFAGFLGLQCVLLPEVSRPHVLMAVVYLLWAAGLMLLGRQLRTIFGMGKTCDALACYILIGAVISALIALVQHINPQGILSGLVAAKITPQASAHLGQSNHLTDYLALGLASLGYLLLRFNLKAGLTGLLALLLILAMTLTGSRSAWLYLVVLTILGLSLGLWSLRRLQADGAKTNTAKVFFIGLIPAFALLQVVVRIPWFASSAPIITAMDRMEHTAGNFHDRLNIWHAAWIMFKDAPWFGLGWGEFDWGYFERASLLAVSTVDQRVNHAHNLFIQLLAETGAVGLLLIVMGVATWLLRVFRAGYHCDHHASSHSPLPCFLFFAVLGVLSIHTMLEYPLWYAYFLGIAALLMGLADPQDFPVGSSLRRAIVLISGIGLFLATSLAWDYSKIEHWLVSARRFQVVDADLPQFREDMLSVRRNPLLAPYVDVTLALSAEPSLDHLQDKLTLSTSAVHFEPVADLVFAQAVLLSLAGRQEEAYQLLDLALVAYPASAGKQVKELSILSVRDPGTYRPLLEYVQPRLERKQNSAAVSD